jgi:hypothetical protein
VQPRERAGVVLGGHAVVPSPPRDFARFLDECLQELIQRQKAIAEQWGIDSCERWEVDQSRATITFLNTCKGYAKLLGDVQIIGTYNASDKMWFWSWANNSIAAPLQKDALQLKEYGTKHLRMRLTEKGWKGDLEDAWKMTALAVKLFGADAVYRGPAGRMDVFMVIRNLQSR